VIGDVSGVVTGAASSLGGFISDNPLLDRLLGKELAKAERTDEMQTRWFERAVETHLPGVAPLPPTPPPAAPAKPATEKPAKQPVEQKAEVKA